MPQEACKSASKTQLVFSASRVPGPVLGAGGQQRWAPQNRMDRTPCPRADIPGGWSRPPERARQVLSPRRNLAVSGDIFGFCNPGDGCCWQLVGGQQGWFWNTERDSGHRTATTVIQPQTPIVPRWRSPVLGGETLNKTRRRNRLREGAKELCPPQHSQNEAARGGPAPSPTPSERLPPGIEPGQGWPTAAAGGPRGERGCVPAPRFPA